MSAFVIFLVVGAVGEMVEDEDEGGSEISDDLRGECR
jgi:hypothetical protein